MQNWMSMVVPMKRSLYKNIEPDIVVRKNPEEGC